MICQELLDFIYRQVPVKKPNTITIDQIASPVQSHEELRIGVNGKEVSGGTAGEPCKR